METNDDLRYDWAQELQDRSDEDWQLECEDRAIGGAPAATQADAVREWVYNVGAYDRFKDCEWLLTNYDTWEKNPHYSGPPQRHPEEDDYLEAIAEAPGTGPSIAIPAREVTYDDGIPF